MNSNTTNAAKAINWDAVERAIELQPWRPGTGADPDRGPYEIRDVQILTADERPADEAGRLAIFDEANRRGYGIYNPIGGGMGVRQTRYPAAAEDSGLNVANAENALRSIRDAQRRIAEEYALDAATNTFGRELPEWAAHLSADLHAAHGNLVNAIDPGMDRPHGWWERL